MANSCMWVVPHPTMGKGTCQVSYVCTDAGRHLHPCTHVTLDTCDETWYDEGTATKGTNHGRSLLRPRPGRRRYRRVCHGHGLASRPLVSAAQRSKSCVCIAALQQVGDPPVQRHPPVSGRRRHLAPKKHRPPTPLSFGYPLPPRRAPAVALHARPATTIAAHPACAHAPARPCARLLGCPATPPQVYPRTAPNPSHYLNT